MDERYNSCTPKFSCAGGTRRKMRKNSTVPSSHGVKEEDVPHHTFPLPSERNIHAVIRGVPATLKEADIKEELQQNGYAPLHIIRLKRSGAPMPLVVAILAKLEKSRELFNEHELLGLAIRVEVQKNSRLIGQCHHCQKYGHAQSYCTAPPKLQVRTEKGGTVTNPYAFGHPAQKILNV
nr:unnamed protein product [Callosobruchus analis]